MPCGQNPKHKTEVILQKIQWRLDTAQKILKKKQQQIKIINPLHVNISKIKFPKKSVIGLHFYRSL